jgi:deferrochelatase/peroxidase EfeB
MATGAYAPERTYIMNTTDKTNQPIPTDKSEQPDLVKRIGKTTYKVKAHFSTTSKETMSDKIKRMLRNEVSQSSKL